LSEATPAASTATVSEAVHVVAWLDGHGGHGGLTFDPATELIGCRCGAILYELEEVALMGQQWTAEQQAWLDTLDGKTYKTLPGDWAALRCTKCPHIAYLDDGNGGACRFCGCREHVSAESTKRDGAA